MPISEPHNGEEQDDFISRCMSFLEEEGSSLDQDQRLAACFSKWRQAKGEEIAPQRRMSTGYK